MKLLKLTIHNIASIENAVIDFAEGPLADDTRFLICGPLGSGKTTILDAICLALYNTTPRLKNASNESYTDVRDDFKTARDDGSVSIDDPRMLMRRGSVKSSVELAFTDRNDNLLTASWSCSKAREKADGKIQDVRWTLYDASGNEISSKKSETEKEIIARTGLTFEQFSRTTMLAQGEFTRFLKARDSDKSDILEKLTGTGIYSRISISIQKTMAEKKDMLMKKEAEMSGIELMPDSLIREAEARIAENTKMQAILAEKEAGLKEIIGMSEKEAELTSGLRKCGQRKEELLAEFLRLSSGLEFLREYVKRQECMLGNTEEFIGKEKPKAGIYSDIGRLSLLLANAENAEKERLERLSDAAKAKDAAEKMKASAGIIAERLAEAVKADAEVGRQQEEVRRILAEMNIEALLEQKETAADSLDKIKEYAGLRKKCLKAKEDHERLAGQAASSKQQLEEAEHAAAGLEKAAASAAEAYRLQEKIYEAKQTACGDIIKEIRSRLRLGDTCPLCGQHISSLACDEDFESVLEPERQKKEELRDDYEQARHKADKNTACIAELRKTYEAALKMAIDAEKGYEDLCKELTLHPVHASLPAEKDIDEALQLAEASIEATKSTLAAKIQEAIAIQKSADNLQIQKNRSSAEVQKAEEETEAQRRKITEKTNEATSMLQAAERMEKEYANALSAADSIMAAVKTWKEEWKASHSAFLETLTEDARKYNAECDNAIKIRHNLSLTDSVYNAVLSCRKQILALYPQWQDCTIPAPCKAEGLTEKWNTLYADAKSLSDHKRLAEDELSALRAKAESKGIADMAKAAGEAYAELEETRREYERCSIGIGADKEKIANDLILRSRLGKLAEETEKAREEYVQWHRLYDIFGSSDGKKFRNIAQSYVLRQLLAGANVYLRQLTGRYELEGQPGSLTILLKDKEAGGVLRPTSTISGGESFLTSLALALGLSSLSNRSMSMDILFIDEGFGTLDSTYLGTVMDALEQLHQMGGRKIGIISHVESLKERLTTQIQVMRVNSTLSRIEVKNIL